MKESVLLFSGGMDSLIASRMFPRAIKLYIEVGSAYEEKEIAFINRTPTLANSVIFDRRLRLSDMERQDAIIPARNLFLVAIASFHSSEVILSSVNGDGSTDKDQTFADFCTSLLTHIYSPPHFPAGVITRVSLPLKHMSKPELVKWYVSNDGDVALLQDSVSCYHPHYEQCGTCKACIRKWVALESNGIPTSNWTAHPSLADWAPHISKIVNRTWRCSNEDEATEFVLRRYGVI